MSRVDEDAAGASTVPTQAPAALRLVGLTRTFGEITAVNRLELTIAEGEFFSLIGPSGCGKTTTLRMIAGLERPTSGRVFVGERDVTDEPAHRRPVNTVFQQYALFPHLNVFENVAFGLRERRLPRRTIAEKVERILDVVGLLGRERARPRELSGGQQQRVGLARALVMEPRVLLLDEPLGALDLRLRKQMQTLLKNVQHEVKITFVYVTHDQEEAFSMSDRVGVMSGGLLEQVGSPQEVYRRPSTLFVADFVGASNRLDGILCPGAGPGSYSVELSGGWGTLEASGRPGLEPGTPVAVIVRPEAMRFGFSAEADPTINAFVLDVSYLGPQVVYTVAAEALGELRIIEGGREGPRYGPGDAVSLHWSSSTAWVVSHDDELPR